ncbi:hypothetical protein Nepgr_024318 [Nepenthes gracilis]|uniref:Glycosyl transferase CAP10 domain-containing protein n=1 Tax=Nepenthes gracilis TaxID=150966 RepID=A0AAD3T2V9_NEPGR|nr:hypothetical protein Nepgr_024318 [Nepenthes gracilis]
MEEPARSFRSRVNELFSSVLGGVRRPTTSFSKTFSATTACLLILVLLVGTIASNRWIDMSTFRGISFQRSLTFDQRPRDYPLRDEYLLNCTTTNTTLTCPANYPPPHGSSELLNTQQCPNYFRWIHEDMKPWKKKGITREMVESSGKFAHFQLVIVNGTAYVKQHDKAFQTRDVLTLWGVLQLLKLYPGQLPDLDLMFQCHDQPSIKKNLYMGSKAAEVPPLFHFCGSDSTFDIVFPDWSFWGWPEINIKPWVPLMKDIEEGNKRINWTDRKPFASWKGNLYTGQRQKLAKCNSVKDWTAAIHHQDWGKEAAEGFKNSDLSEQCTDRYKIYIEGNAWSVSNKYILACDSMTLLVNPIFYEFFTRSLVPLKHYWPINDHPDQICRSIKFAVEWGIATLTRHGRLDKQVANLPRKRYQ